MPKYSVEVYVEWSVRHVVEVEAPDEDRAVEEASEFASVNAPDWMDSADEEIEIEAISLKVKP